MSNFNQQDADMIPHQGSHRGNRGRGRGYQCFDSPFENPAHHGFRGNQQQQSYYNRGNRGNRSNWRGFRGGRGRGNGRGNHRGREDNRSFDQQKNQLAKSYMIPAMTCNPWAELEKQYEASKKT